MATADVEDIVKSAEIMQHIKHKYESGSLQAKWVLNDLDFSDGILYDHNKEAYKLMLEGLTQTGCALIEHATGLGKSYIMGKYLKDGFSGNGKRVLYLVNQDSIIENFKRTLRDENVFGKDFLKSLNIKFATYQGAKSLIDEKYDLIICDEAHHLGASVWRNDVYNVLAGNVDADLIGLSATIKREDKIDITKIFGKPVSSFSLLRAYEEGVLTPPHYYICEMNFVKYGKSENEVVRQIEKLQEREQTSMSGDEKRRARKLIQDYKIARSMMSTDANIGSVLSNIFKQIKQKDADAKTYDGKFVVFCPIGLDKDTQSRYLDKIFNDAQNLWFKDDPDFKGINVHVIHSQQNQNKNREILQKFTDDTSDKMKVLFNINMFSEGNHVDDIDGVVMLRPTESEALYVQQLGRINSASKNKKAWVVDCVSNAVSLANGDLTENLDEFVLNVFGNEQDRKKRQAKARNGDIKSEKSHFVVEFDEMSKDVIMLLQKLNREYDSLKNEYDKNYTQRLLEAAPYYAAAHPECCDAHGRIVVLPKQSEIFKYQNKNGEDVVCHIGQDLNRYKQVLKGNIKGVITEEEKQEIDKHYKIEISYEKNNYVTRLLEAAPYYAAAHPECCDEHGRIVVLPKAKEIFKYQNKNGEVVEYPIGQDLQRYKQVLKGTTKGVITEEEKQEINKLFKLDQEKNNYVTRLLEVAPLYAAAHPECCDEHGRIVVLPKAKEIFKYQNQNGEDVVYQIGKDLNIYKQVLKGTLKGIITEEEKQEIDKHYKIEISYEKNNYVTRLLEAAPYYAAAHPESCDEHGRIVLPKWNETFKYQNRNGEDVVYQIGQDLHKYKQVLKGNREGKITEEEKQEIDKHYKIEISYEKNNYVTRLLEVAPLYAEAHPESCDEYGRIVVLPKTKEIFKYQNQNGKIVEYPIGRDLHRYKQVLKGTSKGIITEEEKQEINKLYKLEKNNYLTRLLEAAPLYAAAHPESCDEYGRIVLPKWNETFKYQKENGEDVVYQIGQDLQTYKRVLKGSSKCIITEEEKQKMDELYKIDITPKKKPPTFGGND